MFTTMEPKQNSIQSSKECCNKKFQLAFIMHFENSNSSQQHKQPKSLVHYPSCLNFFHMIQFFLLETICPYRDLNLELHPHHSIPLTVEPYLKSHIKEIYI